MISGEDPQRTILMVGKGIRQQVPKELEEKYPHLTKVAKKCSKPLPNNRPVIEDVKSLLEK
jgi:hypothetical protein